MIFHGNGGVLHLCILCMGRDKPVHSFWAQVRHQLPAEQQAQQCHHDVLSLGCEAQEDDGAFANAARETKLRQLVLWSLFQTGKQTWQYIYIYIFSVDSLICLIHLSTIGIFHCYVYCQRAIIKIYQGFEGY